MPSGGSLGPLPQPTTRGHQHVMAPLPRGLGRGCLVTSESQVQDLLVFPIADNLGAHASTSPDFSEPLKLPVCNATFM